jgi:hypothetical protein
MNTILQNANYNKRNFIIKLSFFAVTMFYPYCVPAQPLNSKLHTRLFASTTHYGIQFTKPIGIGRNLSSRIVYGYSRLFDSREVILKPTRNKPYPNYPIKNFAFAKKYSNHILNFGWCATRSVPLFGATNCDITFGAAIGVVVKMDYRYFYRLYPDTTMEPIIGTFYNTDSNILLQSNNIYGKVPLLTSNRKLRFAGLMDTYLCFKPKAKFSKVNNYYPAILVGFLANSTNEGILFNRNFKPVIPYVAVSLEMSLMEIFTKIK